MVDLLGESGADVTVQDTTPGASTDVAVLLSDSTSQDMTDELERWVAAGGTLVVADPRSSFVPVRHLDLDIFGVVDRTVQRADCTIDALDGIDQVQPGAGVLYDVAGVDASPASRGSSGAFVVDTPTGQGHIVAIGSAVDLHERDARASTTTRRWPWRSWRPGRGRRWRCSTA